MRTYTFIALFFTGAAVMVLELVGARLLAPYFGVSLYVWTSQISVALVSLAIGYRLGGIIADRRISRVDDRTTENRQDIGLLYLLILISGICILAIPPISRPVMEATGRLGLRFGALAASFALFAAPFVILGMLSPYAVRLLAGTASALGTAAGNTYAVSTMGGFCGAVLTGLVLIPAAGITKILRIQAFILVLLWAGWLALDRILRGRRKDPKRSPARSKSVGILAFLAPFFLVWALLSPQKEFFSTKGAKVLHECESLYGLLTVLDRGDERWLLIDGVSHTAIDKATGESLFDYPYYAAIVPFMRPDTRDVLVIGMGGGSVTRAYGRLGIKADSVDIDPAVARIAREFFGYPADCKAHISDGRYFVRTAGRKYDSIVVDTYASDTLPAHMTTREAFADIRMSLRPRGVVVVNYVGFRTGPGAAVWESLYQSIKTEFPHVRAFTPQDGGGLGNIVFLASPQPLKVEREITPETCGSRVFSELLHEMLAKEISLDNVAGPVLTDDFNPADKWWAGVTQAWRGSMKFLY